MSKEKKPYNLQVKLSDELATRFEEFCKDTTRERATVVRALIEGLLRGYNTETRDTAYADQMLRWLTAVPIVDIDVETGQKVSLSPSVDQAMAFYVAAHRAIMRDPVPPKSRRRPT